MSHVVKVTSGVSQDSVWGPVLFNLFFKNAEMIAKSYGFSVHSEWVAMRASSDVG